MAYVYVFLQSFLHTYIVTCTYLYLKTIVSKIISDNIWNKIFFGSVLIRMLITHNWWCELLHWRGDIVKSKGFFSLYVWTRLRRPVLNPSVHKCLKGLLPYMQCIERRWRSRTCTEEASARAEESYERSLANSECSWVLSTAVQPATTTALMYIWIKSLYMHK